MTNKKIGFIVAGVVGGLAALVFGALIVRMVIRAFSKSPKASAPYGFTGHGSTAYRPLHAPAPQAASDAHALPNLHYDGSRY
jgi:hypothetical protein